MALAEIDVENSFDALRDRISKPDDLNNLKALPGLIDSSQNSAPRCEA